MARRTDYQRLAGRYDEDRAHFSIERDDPIETLLASSGTAVTVLDVGCGTAIYLTAQERYFEGSPVRWIGMDASRAMLDIARTKSSGTKLALGRAERLPFGEGTIDFAHSSFAFHHFEDKDAALDEIARVLRIGGRLRIRNMDPWGQPDWWVYRYFSGTREADQTRFWPAERLGAEIERRGFEVEVRVRTENTSRTAGDILAEAERRVISQLAILDDAAFAAGIERLRSLPTDEPVAYERARLRLTARKTRS